MPELSIRRFEAVQVSLAALLAALRYLSQVCPTNLHTGWLRILLLLVDMDSAPFLDIKTRKQ
jgi:predicted secreted protein